MIWLWILLGVIALLAFLLCANLHLVFQYHTAPRITLRYLFFKWDGKKLFDTFVEKRKTKPEKVPAESTSQTEKKSGADIVGFAQFLKHIAQVIGLAIKEHFAKMTVNLKELHVSVATEDAAETAMAYTLALNAANGLCALLQHFSRFRCDNRNLSISPSFSSDKTHFSIHLDLSSKPIHLIAVILRSYIRFFEGKEVKK